MLVARPCRSGRGPGRRCRRCRPRRGRGRGRRSTVGTGPRARFGHQDVGEHAHTRPGVEDDLLATITGKRSRFENCRPKRHTRRREAADELGQLRPQRLLLSLGFGARARTKSKLARGPPRTGRVCRRRDRIDGPRVLSLFSPFSGPIYVLAQGFALEAAQTRRLPSRWPSARARDERVWPWIS